MGLTVWCLDKVGEWNLLEEARLKEEGLHALGLELRLVLVLLQGQMKLL